MRENIMRAKCRGIIELHGIGIRTIQMPSKIKSVCYRPMSIGEFDAKRTSG